MQRYLRLDRISNAISHQSILLNWFIMPSIIPSHWNFNKLEFVWSLPTTFFHKIRIVMYIEWISFHMTEHMWFYIGESDKFPLFICKLCRSRRSEFNHFFFTYYYRKRVIRLYGKKVCNRNEFVIIR